MDQLLSIFDVKYTEFTQNLLEALPELDSLIRSAAALDPPTRLKRFKEEILPSLKPENVATIRTILPGVTLTESVWISLGDDGQKAIQQFLSVLGVCCAHDSDVWSREFFEGWKNTMDSVDFDGIAAKLAAAFGETGAKMPQIPERLLKGQLAKLAEEILREFKPEEFGFTPAMMAAAEENPARAFELITEIYTKNPEVLQTSMKRIMSRLQDKIRRGQFKPQEIAQEAEELMKELTGNSAFKDLLESLKGSFGFGDDPDLATPGAAAGGTESERRSIIRERLRKKLAGKKKA